MKRTFFVAMVLFIAVGRVSLAVSPIVTNQSDVIGITMPLYGVDKSKPAALLHVGKASIGAQRQGFLRVGILPLLVLSKVEIDFASKPADVAALAYLATAFETLGETSAAELHDVTIVVCGQPVLIASQGKLAADASVRLWKVILTSQAAHPLDAVTLHTTGAKAGEVTYQSNNGPQTENLFVK